VDKMLQLCMYYALTCCMSGILGSREKLPLNTIHYCILIKQGASKEAVTFLKFLMAPTCA